MLMTIDSKQTVFIFSEFFDVRLLSLLIQVNVFSSYTLFDNSLVVVVILLFIHWLSRVIPATKLLYSLSHFW
jgi:hypothetical protein